MGKLIQKTIVEHDTFDPVRNLWRNVLVTAIEDAIKALQIEQRGIQDHIYNKQKFINDETERLEDLYEVGKNELALLKGELTSAANEQKRLADEAQRYKNIIAGGGGNTSSAPPAPSPVNGVKFDQPIETGID